MAYLPPLGNIPAERHRREGSYETTTAGWPLRAGLRLFAGRLGAAVLESGGDLLPPL